MLYDIFHRLKLTRINLFCLSMGDTYIYIAKLIFFRNDVISSLVFFFIPFFLDINVALTIFCIIIKFRNVTEWQVRNFHIASFYSSTFSCSLVSTFSTCYIFSPVAPIIYGCLCFQPPKKRIWYLLLWGLVQFQYQWLPIFSSIYEFSDILLASLQAKTIIFFKF